MANESGIDQTPGLGQINVEVYKDLLPNVQGLQSRMLVADLMEKLAENTDESILPADKRSDFLETANRLRISRSEDWAKPKTS